jgi:hypothetical protein
VWEGILILTGKRWRSTEGFQAIKDEKFILIAM